MIHVTVKIHEFLVKIDISVKIITSKGVELFFKTNYSS